MSFIEAVRTLPVAQQKKAVADFLLLNVKYEIKRGFVECIRQWAGNLPHYSPAANLEVEKIEVEAIEDHPDEEDPTNNVFGWAIWKADKIGGDFHFDIGENEHADISWLTVTLELPTTCERRDAEEEW